MGKTKTIEDKQKSDEEFRNFMKQLDDESKIEEDKLHKEVLDLVERHYDDNKWDKARFFGEKRSDYQNYDDWSLDRINAIIQSIGDALSGGDYPSNSVPGSDGAAPSTIEEAKAFLGAFAADYTLIIARVKALIAGALTQFSVKSSVNRKSELRDMALSGGLHLFFASSGKVMDEKRFFTSQYIASFQIVFEVYMSVDEARAILIQQILKTTEEELVLLNESIISLRKRQLESIATIPPDQFDSTYAAYGIALNTMKKDRDDLVVVLDSYKHVTSTVDALHEHLDLTEHGRPNKVASPIRLHQVFPKDQLPLAHRYIKEKLAA